jgi:hypothetical protein
MDVSILKSEIIVEALEFTRLERNGTTLLVPVRKQHYQFRAVAKAHRRAQMERIPPHIFLILHHATTKTLFTAQGIPLWTSS